MEKVDRSAYRVLKNNYTPLCTDLDARRVAAEVAKVGLISREERRAVCDTAGREGVSRGVEHLLDLLTSKSREGVFQKFVEILQSHSDLKFWADCLNDEYETEKIKLAQGDGSKGRPLLRRSLEPLDGETPPIVRRRLSELSLLNDFNQEIMQSREELTDLLSRFDGDLKCLRDVEQKSLLHIACEKMDFIIVKLLVEQYQLDLNAQDSEGNTPLHIACLNQKTQNAIYLMKLPSCDLNIRNSNCLTPLHIAAQAGQGILISHLLAMPTLDRSVEDEEGRTAVDVIRSDPKLASYMDRKISSGSLASFSSSGRRSSDGDVLSKAPSRSSRRSSEPEVKRKVSGQSNPDGYTRCLLEDNEAESSLESEDGKTVRVIPALSNNGVHAKEDGIELEEFKIGDSEEGGVVLREKVQKDEDEEEEPTTSCSCCRRNKQYQLAKTNQTFHIKRVFWLCRVLSILFLGIFVGLLVIGALVYFLITRSDDNY